MSIYASFKIHVSTAHFVAFVQGWEVVLEEAAWDWQLRMLSLGIIIINVFASFKIHVSTAHFVASVQGWEAVREEAAWVWLLTRPGRAGTGPPSRVCSRGN